MAVIWSEERDGTRYEVRAAGATRRLYTDGVFHSAYHPQHSLTGGVWDLFLVAGFCREEPPRRVLVLGAGAGAALMQIRRFLDPAVLIGVDLDPVHLQVARDHFGVAADTAELVEADARDWIADYAGPAFDLVVEDLFGHPGGEPVRSVDVDLDWARALDGLVAPGGVLAANFISVRDLHRSTLVADRRLRRRFATAFRLQTPVDDNAVGVFCRADTAPAELRQRLRRVPELDTRRRRCRLRYDLRSLW